MRTRKTDRSGKRWRYRRRKGKNKHTDRRVEMANFFKYETEKERLENSELDRKGDKITFIPKHKIGRT